MGQRVFKCPLCGANLLLWTGICIRCGRVDEAVVRRVTPPHKARPESAAPGQAAPRKTASIKKADAEGVAGGPSTSAPRPQAPSASPAPATSSSSKTPSSTEKTAARASASASEPPRPVEATNVPEKVSLEEMFGESVSEPVDESLSGLAETSRFTDIVPDASVYADSAGRRDDDGGVPTNLVDTATLAREVVYPQAPQAAPATRRTTAPASGLRHFLVLGFKDAIELEPGKRISIGRHPSSSVRIDQPQISRKHAEIDWSGDPPRAGLRDAGRSNTYLNGEAVPRDPLSPLKDGDVILLGRSFKMVYRRAENASDLFPASARLRSPPPDPASAPQPAARPPAPPPAREPGEVPLEGDFGTAPPLMVLESIFRRELTGILMISTGAGTGTMDVERGRAKNVVFGTFSGKDAVEQITRLKEGIYRFLKA
ncbi:FHA domain-containing protein [bacterium]|nr:FHA domain-containing protein [bacterium]